jgi:ribosome silencing factor RsfS/YbeB/iojap
LATSETRARPRKAATPKATSASAPRNKSAAAKAPASAKKTAARKPAPAKKLAAAKKATPGKLAARKAPALHGGKAVANAGPTRAEPRAPKAKAPKLADAGARLRKIVIDALDDLKAKDVSEIDVRGKSGVTDLMVLASGTSSRHVKSIADEVVKKAKHAGNPPIGVEGQREGEWVLVDLGDVIVHVMLPRTREFYGLERLWTVGDDAPATLAG